MNHACVLLTGIDLDPVADFLGEEALVLANRDDHACVLTGIDLDPVADFLGEEAFGELEDEGDGPWQVEDVDLTMTHRQRPLATANEINVNFSNKNICEPID